MIQLENTTGNISQINNNFNRTTRLQQNTTKSFLGKLKRVWRLGDEPTQHYDLTYLIRDHPRRNPRWSPRTLLLLLLLLFFSSSLSNPNSHSLKWNKTDLKISLPQQYNQKELVREKTKIPLQIHTKLPCANSPTSKGHNSLIRTRNHANSTALERSFHELRKYNWKYL